MKRLKDIYEFVKSGAGEVVTFVAIVLAIGTAVTWVSGFFAWGNSGPFQWLQRNIVMISILGLWLAIIALAFYHIQLQRRFISRFRDSFRGDLRGNWDFEGDWRIVEKKTLLVTNSEVGGITKIGAQWENYTFTFTARIMQSCLGVIVRARDLNDYYMFQVHADKIRPHRRVSLPEFETQTTSPPTDNVHNEQKPKATDATHGVSERTSESQDGETLSAPKGSEGKCETPTEPRSLVRFRRTVVGWQLFNSIPLKPELEGWFEVKVVVRGQSVSIYIDDELMFQEEAFLHIPTGKVGFRNWDCEAAHVRDVKVVVEP